MALEHESEIQRGLFDALLDAAHRFGAGKPILEDQERRPLSYTDIIRASCALGRKIAATTKPKECVGVLLPSSAAAVVKRTRLRWRQAAMASPVARWVFPVPGSPTKSTGSARSR